MTPTNEQIRSAIAQQAAVWFLAHRTGTLPERDRQEFMDWLRLSPLNIGEYLAIAGVARDLPAAAAALPLPEISPPTRTGAEYGHSRRWSLHSWGWRLRLAGAALGLIAVLATAYAVFKDAWSSLLPAATYQTGHGQQSSWTLADGSLLRLNTDSEVKVRLGRVERVIELERGQIFLRVAHDAQRRLRVQVGGSNLVAMGTQFDVYRLREGVTLTVIDGEVTAYVGETSSPESRGAVMVHANEQLRIDPAGGASAPSAVDARAAEAWLNRQIIFHERPLGEVAEEFSRYAPLPIEVSDPRLRRITISGDFDAYDSESFLAFLRANGDVTIRREADRIVVSSR